MSYPRLRIVLTAGVLVGLAPLAHGGTLYVANNGVDGPTCGPKASPCRSITQATANATAGDQIVVGPGFYSNDLNGNGILGEPGEESGGGIPLTTTLTILSSDGASGTFINMVGSGGAAFNVNANNAVIGKKSKGFSINVPDGWTGVLTGNFTTGITVAGIFVSHVPASGTLSAAVGFGDFGNGNVFRDNRVVGYNVSNLKTFGDVGYFMFGTNAVLDHNVAQGCNDGFVVSGNAVLTRNLAIGNLVFGFDLGTFASFTGNAALGNSGVGVELNQPGGVLTKNSFVGNDTAGSNCGVSNDSGGTVTASGNFWGAATGPGPDPADQACNGFGSTTITSPFATTDFTPVQSAQR
jgi:hypothetical protein